MDQIDDGCHAHLVLLRTDSHCDQLSQGLSCLRVMAESRLNRCRRKSQHQVTVNALSEATNNPTIAAIAGVVVGFLLTEFGPKLVQAFEQRYIDPKKRHRQVFLDQADWLEERAQKVNVLVSN